MQQVIDFFSRYIQISETEKPEMLSMLKLEKVPKNTLLLKQGMVGRHGAFILKGALRAYYTDSNGSEHTVAFYFENSPVLALETYLHQTPSFLSIATIEETEFALVAHSDLKDFLVRHPQYETVFTSILTEALGQQAIQTKLLRISSSRERYETFCKIYPEILLRVPLKYIASYLEMAMETLSRVRAGKL